MNKNIKLFAESEYFIQDPLFTTCVLIFLMFFKFFKFIKDLNKNFRQPYK